MSFFVYPLLTALIFSSITNVTAAEQPSEVLMIQEPSTRKFYPIETTISYNGKEYPLQLTGVALRKKFFVNIYSIAHYMQNPPKRTDANIFQEIVNDDQVKEVIFDWAHSATSKQVRDGYYESFHRTLSDNEFHKLKKEIDQYLSFFSKDIAEGDRHIVRWLPGGILELEIGGEKVGTITNMTFLKSLWSIWFGPKSILERDKLISCLR